VGVAVDWLHHVVALFHFAGSSPGAQRPGGQDNLVIILQDVLQRADPMNMLPLLLATKASHQSHRSHHGATNQAPPSHASSAQVKKQDLGAGRRAHFCGPSVAWGGCLPHPRKIAVPKGDAKQNF